MSQWEGLEQAALRMNAGRRDCRECKAFRPSDTGLAFGWCIAFKKNVKLYHPARAFWSQCQFELLTKPGPGELIPLLPPRRDRRSPTG